jgi:hypothetical protein
MFYLFLSCLCCFFFVKEEKSTFVFIVYPVVKVSFNAAVASDCHSSANDTYMCIYIGVNDTAVQKLLSNIFMNDSKNYCF